MAGKINDFKVDQLLGLYLYCEITRECFSKRMKSTIRNSIRQTKEQTIVHY